MKPEIEAKFIVSSHENIKQKLLSVGACRQTPKRLMRRIYFGNADGVEDTHLRLRDEGDKITLTHKEFTGIKKIDGITEVEVEVSSFNDTRALFEAVGFTVINETETYRETWKLDKCNVELDEWPWIPGYIEIEGPSKESAKQLDLNWDEAIFGGVRELYLHYYPRLPKDTKLLKSIKFSDKKPEIL